MYAIGTAECSCCERSPTSHKTFALGNGVSLVSKQRHQCKGVVSCGVGKWLEQVAYPSMRRSLRVHNVMYSILRSLQLIHAAWMASVCIISVHKNSVSSRTRAGSSAGAAWLLPLANGRAADRASLALWLASKLKCAALCECVRV